MLLRWPLHLGTCKHLEAKHRRHSHASGKFSDDTWPNMDNIFLRLDHAMHAEFP